MEQFQSMADLGRESDPNTEKIARLKAKIAEIQPELDLAQKRLNDFMTSAEIKTTEVSTEERELRRAVKELDRKIEAIKGDINHLQTPETIVVEKPDEMREAA